MVKKIESINNRIVSYFMDLIAVIIISVIGIYHWKDMDMLAVFGDEFGYWGNASFLAGYDWKSLMSETAYYSIGYSLCILPIMFIKNYVVRYHIAIILNIILVIGCYFCARYIAVYIFKNESKIKQVCSSLVSVLTVNVIVQMRVAWDETMICFLMWFSIVLMINIHKSYKSYKLIVISILLIYMIMTHQRTLPIVLIFILIMLIEYRHKIDWKKSFLLLVAFMILYVGYKYAKAFQITNIYSDSANADINNYTISGNLIKRYLQAIFNNFQTIVISLWAKFVMYNICTGFTFLITSVVTIKSFINKTGEENNKCNVIRYIWISGIIMMCLTAIHVSGTSRADLVVYTRYFDFTIGPMILVGINCLDEKKVNYRIYLLLSLAFSLLSISNIYDYIYSAENGFNYICSPIIAGNILWFDEYMKESNVIKALTCKVILEIGVLIFLYIKWKSEKIMVAVTTSILIVTIILANYTSDAVNRWREYYREDTITLSENITDSDIEVYFILDENNTNLLNLMMELQYVSDKKSIVKINKEKLHNILSDEYYLITTEKYDRKDFELIISSNVHKVNLYYVKKG